jgi:hypothetical protein
MAKKKGKTVSFDAMIKFFIRNYDIPTRKDFNKLITKFDRLEKIVKKSAQISAGKAYGSAGGRPAGRHGLTASDMVLGVVKTSKKGACFSDIQAKTGFNDKKLRNIIFRLNKLQNITRRSRGIYIVK